MMYYETFRLLWDREWENGLRFKVQARTERDEPTAALFYQSSTASAFPRKTLRSIASISAQTTSRSASPISQAPSGLTRSSDASR